MRWHVTRKISRSHAEVGGFVRDQVIGVVEQYIDAVRRNDPSNLPLHPEVIGEFPMNTYRGAESFLKGLVPFPRSGSAAPSTMRFNITATRRSRRAKYPVSLARLLIKPSSRLSVIRHRNTSLLWFRSTVSATPISATPKMSSIQAFPRRCWRWMPRGFRLDSVRQSALTLRSAFLASLVFGNISASSAVATSQFRKPASSRLFLVKT